MKSGRAGGRPSDRSIEKPTEQANDSRHQATGLVSALVSGHLMFFPVLLDLITGLGVNFSQFSAGSSPVTSVTPSTSWRNVAYRLVCYQLRCGSRSTEAADAPEAQTRCRVFDLTSNDFTYRSAALAHSSRLRTDQLRSRTTTEVAEKS